MEKSLVVSVRLSRSEVEYLATSRTMAGSTLSEKVRSLIVKAKKSEESSTNYGLLRDLTDEQCKQTMHKIQQREFDCGVRSELVSYVFTWLPEFLAYYLSYHPDPGPISRTYEAQPKTAIDLIQFEKGIATRLLSIVSHMLRFCNSATAPTYSKDNIDVADLKRLCRHGLLTTEELS